MLEWRLGTMGFGYSEWANVFYPRGLPSSEQLPFYARHFDTLELDTTFHAVPPVERVQRWAAAVPDDFRFCVKTPRTITHDAALVAAAEPMRAFLRAVREFGEKLGVVLMQFPPTFEARHFERLAAFLGDLPTDLRYAIEFRHDSWWETTYGDTAALLRDHRVCWVASDASPDPRPDARHSDDPLARRAPTRYRPRPLIITADFLYLRWIGVHGQFPEMNAERFDPTPRLGWWKERIDRELRRQPQGQRVHTIWGLFNNDYAGYAPGTARRFKSILGLPVPSITEPGQPLLFE
jgi:uncharacterized protein YecE (DUF72 family)